MVLGDSVGGCGGEVGVGRGGGGVDSAFHDKQITQRGRRSGKCIRQSWRGSWMVRGREHTEVSKVL